MSSETDLPAVIELRIDDGESVRVVVPDPTPGTEHETPVLGLRPDRTVEIEVAAVDGAGNATTAPERLVFAPPAFPQGFPLITVSRAVDTALAERGVTLFNTISMSEEQPSMPSYLVIVDGNGEVVWFYEDGIGISDVRRLRNGNLLFVSGSSVVREIDMLGNTVAEWNAIGHDPELEPDAIPVDTDSFHHEVYELPDGDAADFLVLSSELRTLPDYPLNETSPTQTESEARVMGDVIVAFRRDGTVVQEWKVLDILDPYRISHDSLDPEWQLVYDGDTRDWSHGNAVILDPTDGNLIVSLRNQDAVVKIDRETGELVWILGAPERWQPPWSDKLLTPSGASGDGDNHEFGWSFHQHAPMFTPRGGMLLFDNGNQRAIPPDARLDPEERYSRVVEYLINEPNGQVSQTWDYGGPDERWYSGALGDADHLRATGNVLAVDGFRTNLDRPREARIFEVTQDSPPRIVFELTVRDDSPEPEVDWLIYRAERLPSVYP